MVDMGRDPRWGRLLEGAGEDVHLANVIAAARTRGYQAGGVAATVKHFVGYGGGEAGRDYNTAWIPAEQLHDLHLPPFRASLDAGSLSVMAAFNSVNGVPATAHKPMLQDLLRGRWGFRGLVVSDFGSIPELMAHGIARDEAEAARKALVAAGLLAESPLPDSTQPGLHLTATGAERLAALRASLAGALGALPAELWRPVRNTARLVKSLGPVLAPTPQAGSPSAEAQAAETAAPAEGVPAALSAAPSAGPAAPAAVMPVQPSAAPAPVVARPAPAPVDKPGASAKPWHRGSSKKRRR